MELQADIITLSEADVPITSNDMKINYPDYNAELHELKGHNLVRLAVLIKKGIVYQRLKSIEMEDICLMVIKVRISRGKYVHIANIYHQWNLPTHLQVSPDKVGLPAQLDRFDRLMTAINTINKSSIPLIVQGDINIDQWQPNDPLSRPDIRQLNEKLVDFKCDLNLQQCNFKPTRFRNGQNPSLLDLVLCNRPQNINCIETFNSNVADHKCVGFQIHVR